MKHNYTVIFLIMIFWFVISFITNIMGPLIPDIISNFNLTHLALAGFIPTSFFVAYAVMSVPAGIMIEKLSEKTVLTIGFTMPLAGSLLFAISPSYPVLLASSFIIGLGMAMLQTVINPLTRVAGGEENFTFFSVMGQLVFGAASFASPLVYSTLVRNLSDPGTHDTFTTRILSGLTPPDLPWVSLYWVFAVILVVILIVVIACKFPRIELREDEKSGSIDSYRELFKNKIVYLFFIGLLCYTATEQGIANWISEFLKTYHGVNPQTEGAAIVGSFWGLMSVGCLIGLLVLKLFNAKKVLVIACFAALICLFSGIFGSTNIACMAFPALGFTLSVMFSIIMSLGLNSVSRHHGSFAGILCSGIVGGAIGPLLVGWIGDATNLKIAMAFIAVPLLYIMSIGFWARPLVENKTIRLKELFKRS